MPDGTGAELLAALAGPDGQLPCPVVVTTGNDEYELGRQMLRAGAQDFIGKRWMTSESLTRAVENAIVRWQLEKWLRASEAAFKQLAAAVPQPVWMVDATGRLSYVNDRWRSFFGDEAAAAAGDGWSTALPIEDAGTTQRTTDLRQSGEPFELDARLPRADGASRWHQVNAVPVRDLTGAVVGWYGVNTDIHERKTAEALLSASKRELQRVTDNSPDIIVRFDRELRHVFINATIEKIAGRPAADFLGKTNQELGMPPDLCERWDAALRSVFATGEPAEIEFAFSGARGARYLASRIVAELGPDGQVESLLGVVSDVTARRQAEDALRASEERLARGQRAARMGTWDWNVLTGAAFWTEEAWRIFGHTPRPDLVSYEQWLGSIHPDDRVAAGAASLAALRTGDYHDEYRVLERDGTIRWVEVFGEVVFDAVGTATRMLGTVQDVTERRHVQEELRAAVRDAELAVLGRDQLASLVSHDLRSPLNTFVMVVAMLKDDPALSVAARGLLVRLDRQASRMGKMIDELLDVSQLQAGRDLDLAVAETDLVPLAREVALEHQEKAPRHRIQVEVSDASVVGVWDPHRLQRVIANLLSNAIKYSPEGGVVKVSIECVRDAGASWAVLRISDTGIGISRKDQERIFDWFSRANNVRRIGIQGIGVGLAGVRKIVEQHGGSIQLESEEKRGSTFTVRLPTRPAQRRLPEESSRPVPALDLVRS